VPDPISFCVQNTWNQGKKRRRELSVVGQPGKVQDYRSEAEKEESKTDGGRNGEHLHVETACFRGGSTKKNKSYITLARNCFIPSRL